VWSYKTGQVFVPGLRGPEALLKVKLETRGWDVLSAYPVMDVGGVDVAVLGLTDKISGAAALVEVPRVLDMDGGKRVEVKLKALGKLGVYCGPGGRGPEGFEDAGAVGKGGGRLWVLDVEKEWRDKDLWRGEDVAVVQIEFR
jgi:hypothetical protein